MRGLRVTKVVKKVTFEGVWGELGSENFSRVNKSQNT